MARFSRAEVRGRLQAQVDAGRAVLLFGAGIGLTARCAELGGADLIGVYSTAFHRMGGRPSLLGWLPYGDVNAELLERSREIVPIVRGTPCIAGVGAHDPRLRLDRLLDELVGLGFSGITNEPFAAMYGPAFAGQLEAAGIGFSKEVELIARASTADLFTVAWAFTPEEAARMAEAGADVIGAMVGVTAGGLTGAHGVIGLEEATAIVQGICEAAHAVRREVMVLTHGGPFADPETAAYSIAHSDAVGYAAGSSGERVPTEEAIIAITRAYKEIAVPRARGTIATEAGGPG